MYSSDEFILLTGNRDVDYYILFHLDRKDYNSLRLTSKYNYFHKILDDDNFWKYKVSYSYGREFINENPLSSWRALYFFWLNYNYGLKLIQTLNFTPVQAYQAIISSTGEIIQGTEAYHTIKRTMNNAFKTGNDELIKYYIKRYRQFKYKLKTRKVIKKKKERTKPDDTFGGGILPIINYVKIIKYALEQGRDKLVKELIEDFFYDPGFNQENYFKVAANLGHANKHDLFTKVLLPLCPKNVLLSVKFSYTAGHFKADRRELAEELFNQYYDEFCIEERVSEKNKTSNYLSTKQIYLCRNSFIYKEIKRAGNMSYKRYKSYFLDALYNSYNWEGTGIIIQSIGGHRYDFILTIEDIYHDGLIDLHIIEWEKIFTEISYFPYKDLYLYLVVKCAQQHPDDYIQILSNVQSGEREIKFLNQVIINIPREELPKTNFHELLMKVYI